MCISDVKAAINNSWNRVIQQVPKSIAVGLLGAAVATAGIFLKVFTFAVNPLAAGVFCFSAHFLRKVVVIPTFDKIFDILKNQNYEPRTIISFVTAMAISSYISGLVVPLLAVSFVKGTAIYAVSLLTCSLCNVA